MPPESPSHRPEHTDAATFPATRWTLVERLHGTEAEAARALDDLCRHYWFPIYATLRSGGRTTHDAEDLTQGFFATLMADRALLAAEPGRGRLRNFLLGALKRFVADEARHRLAQKRGGGTVVLSIEWALAEQRFLTELVDGRDPEKIYFSAWAQSLLDRVREKVRAGFVGRETAFAALAPFIEDEENNIPFRELGERLGQTESGARVTVFRLRQRFRELLTEAVRQTVETPEEVEEELIFVLGALRERQGG